MKKQFALFALVVALLGLGYISYKRSTISLQSGIKTDFDSLFSMKKVHIVQQKEGAKLWELSAERSRDIFSTKDTLFENVSAVVYGQNVIDISATKGSISKGGGDISLSGRVVVSIKKDKITLTTEVARYRDETISIVGPFTITSPRWSFSGKQLTYNTQSEIVEVANGVDATFNDF